MEQSQNKHQTLSAAGILVGLGIIYGDIGTSPLYTLKFIVGANAITNELVLGGVSCIFWTLTLITSIKYIYLALNADNKGEGGIFALYALVRRYKATWVIYPAIIGCCTLIADGFITPAISVSSAVEGIRLIYHDSCITTES
jgi:KUP system potassium uptake protein